VSQLRRLGIDEIALRKGHKDFVVVLSDLDTHALIEMAPARTHAAIEAVLLAWGGEVLSNIEEVSIDLSIFLPRLHIHPGRANHSPKLNICAWQKTGMLPLFSTTKVVTLENVCNCFAYCWYCN